MRFSIPIIAVAASALATFLACRGSSGSATPTTKPGEGVVLPGGGVFTRRALLDAVSQCVYSNIREFGGLAKTFAGSTAAAEVDTSKRAAAQDAWRQAMVTWQRLELMQIGPASMNTLPGGKEYRDAIYSWPLGGRCAVEDVLVSKGYESVDFARAPVTARGLYAAEYLLFSDDTANGCPSTHPMNTGGTWAALSSQELTARKASYARAIGADLVARSTALVDAWSPEKGNFVAELGKAGNGSRLYATDQFALNVVSDAMFYLEFDVKDMKLGEPAGLTKCTTPTCPEKLESQFARHSKHHLRANLQGFRMLFAGCSETFAGLGFDDFLQAVGQGALAKQIEQAILEVVAVLDSLKEDDLRASLQTELGTVQKLHAAVKKVTDLLKAQFVSVLDLELPTRAEGDND